SSPARLLSPWDTRIAPWCSCPSASFTPANSSRCWTFFGRWTCSARSPSPRRSTTSPGTPSRTEDVTSGPSSFFRRGAAQDTGPSRAGALLGDARGHERAGAILEALACYDESIRCAEEDSDGRVLAEALRRRGVLHHLHDEPAPARELCL